MKRQQRLNRFNKEDFIDPALPFRISEYRVNRSWSLHWHDFFEMELILSGSGKQTLNGVEMPLSRGTAYLLTPTDVHEIYPDSGGIELINIKFSEEMIDSATRDRLYRKDLELCARFEGAMYERIVADCRLLEQESQGDKFGKKTWVHGTLGRILVDYIRQADKGADGGRLPAETQTLLHANADYGVLAQALSYVRHHFREPLTLKLVAEKTALSPNYFSERFHELTGQSFQSYLLDLRLAYAMKLLVSSTCPVTEICFAAGFNTLPYFIRMFKKKYGCPPGAARKSQFSPENKTINRKNG